MQSASIQELNNSEVEEVSGGIPLLLAGYLTWYGAKTAYAAGAVIGAGVTLNAIFNDDNDK